MRATPDGYILEELRKRWEIIFYNKQKFSTDTALKSEEKQWKKQVHSAVKTWNCAMLLCAVTEPKTRLVRVLGGGTLESVGKTG